MNISPNVPVDAEQFKAFLLKAKQGAWASGRQHDLTNSDGSKVFKFSEGNLGYTDTFFGSAFFIGTELVYFENKAVWGMNYYGGIDIPLRIQDSERFKKITFAFLREALRKAPPNMPLRGPLGAEMAKDRFKKEYEIGTFEYAHNISRRGRPGSCSGFEQIFFGEEKGEPRKELGIGNEVFRLDYNAGFIVE